MTQVTLIGNDKQKSRLSALLTAVAQRFENEPDKAPEFIVELSTSGDVILLADGWPEIQIGKQGGVKIPALRSYKEELSAYSTADLLLVKQTARDQKKAAETQKAAEVEQKAQEITQVAEGFVTAQGTDQATEQPAAEEPAAEEQTVTAEEVGSVEEVLGSPEAA